MVGMLALNALLLTAFWAVCARTVSPGTARRLYVLFPAGVAVSFAVHLAVYGVGNTWSLASEIGKLLALLLAVSVPLALLTFSMFILLRRRARPAAVLAVPLLVGALGVLAVPLVGVVLACALTGDCL